MNDYVDEQGPKFKFYSFMVEAKHLVTWHRVAFAIGTSLIVSSVAYGLKMAIILVTCVVIAVIVSGRYARYLLGGVMGDYLGATICVTEVFLLSVILLFFENDDLIDLLKSIIQNSDQNQALFRFIIIITITIVWCNLVGHPPVFVRSTLTAAKNKADDSVPIALDTKNKDDTVEDETVQLLQSKLIDPNNDFSDRYNAAWSYMDSLAKPVGSLGTLEEWGCRLAAIQRSAKPSIKKVCCIIFAADHGVAKSKSDGGAECSAYPQSVTEKVLTALAHRVAGAAILSKQNNVSLQIVDVGVASSANASDRNGVKVSSSDDQKVIGGTKNICIGPAMSKEEMETCIQVGRNEVRKISVNDKNINLLVLGEIGIGNTTTSSTLFAALTDESIEVLVGSGATTTRDGISEETIAKKIEIIEDALSHHGKMIIKKDGDSPLKALMNVGGAEIAAIVGSILEASDQNIPVLVDGFIVTTAAMIACLISSKATRILMFATKSTELGQQIALEKIQKIAKRHVPISLPALDMGLRMGEATGALTVVPLVRSAAAIFSELGTLDSILKLESIQDDEFNC